MTMGKMGQIDIRYSNKLQFFGQKEKSHDKPLGKNHLKEMA